MKKIYHYITVAFMVAAGFLCIRLSADGVSLGGPAGSLAAMTIDGGEMGLPAAGGSFGIFDAVKKQNIVFDGSDISTVGDKTVFSAARKDDIRLTAEFSNKGNYILVTGNLENLQDGERGVALSYTIPLPGKSGAVFSNDLNDRLKVFKDEVEGNVFPIAALCSEDGGVALAIPPSSPCEFGMVAGPEGMTMKIYLGISPETANFPNRAAFSFIIYPVDAKWGFRDALAKYYSFYRDYYDYRLDKDGLYIFLAEDGGEPHPANLGLFGSTTLETQVPWFGEWLKKNRENGILSFPYMIVGMREIKFLKTKPVNYAEAMKMYKEWTIENNKGHPVTKEMEASGLDRNLRMQVDSSVCHTAGGDYALAIRYTPWGKESVSFKTNPNPDLFKDTHNQSVGRDSLRLIAQWLDKYPDLDGATLDSLGANWPAIFNYRKDHFKYARYPLTIDPDGRACLHNEISHYEYMETLRDELRARERKMGKKLGILANGIYRYPARSEPAQHYNAGTAKKRTDIGRFFLATLLDIAVSEPGISSPAKSLEFMRVSMGRKYYSPTNARWTDAQKVEDWVNKSLCYTLFGVNTRHYGDKIGYYFPDKWERDEALFAWFTPNCRMLSKAGWEPVTCARASGEKIILERYGSGDTVYFVIMSEAGREQECVVDIDLRHLDFGAGSFSIEEVARNTPLDIGADGKVGLKLKPYKTCIIAVKKKQ